MFYDILYRYFSSTEKQNLKFLYLQVYCQLAHVYVLNILGTAQFNKMSRTELYGNSLYYKHECFQVN